jgi:hypothetical protein
MDRIRGAYVILSTALSIRNAPPLARDGLLDQEEGEVILEGLEGLLQYPKVNQFIDEQSGRV